MESGELGGRERLIDEGHKVQSVRHQKRFRLAVTQSGS